MAKLSSIKSNLALEQEGVWVDFGGIKFRVARMATPKYQAEVRRLTKGKATMGGRSRTDLDMEEIEEIALTTFAKCCLLDWKNLEDDDGNAIPFSQEKALEIISAPEYHDLYTFLQQVAADQSRYRELVEAGDAKN